MEVSGLRLGKEVLLDVELDGVEVLLTLQLADVRAFGLEITLLALDGIRKGLHPFDFEGDVGIGGGLRQARLAVDLER